MIPRVKIQTEIAAFSYLFTQEYIRKILQQSAETHLSIGGQISLTWSENTKAESIITSLEHLSDTIVEGKLKELIPSNLLQATPDDSRTLLSYWTTHIYTDEGYNLIVEIEPQYFFTMHLDFLTAMERRSPIIFRIVQGLIRQLFIAPLSSVCPVGDIMEGYTEMLYEQAEEDGETVFVNNMTYEFSIIDRYLRMNSNAKLEEIKALYKKAKSRIGQEKREWIELVFRFLELSNEMEAVKFLHDNDHDYSYRYMEERASMGEVFLLLWSSGTDVSDYLYEHMNYRFQDTLMPLEPVIIKDSNDIENAARYITFLMLLQIIFYKGDVWYVNNKPCSSGI